MEARPLISVLMGVYNCADTLEEAVQCIIDQSYTNWELIMCDDCSTDNTLQVALSLASKDSRIRVLRNEENQTLAPTLNKCLDVARGEYIARMDGDDICPPERFEKELDFLETYSEYALVSCLMNLFDKNGIYRIVSYKEIPAYADFVSRSQFCHAGCMMRTTVIKDLGGYCVDTKCQRVEDYDLWTRMYSAGYKGYNLQEPLYSMRDDRNAQKRRTFRNRVNESRVKLRVCRECKLPLKSYIHVAIPIVKWLMPAQLYGLAHKAK